MFILVQLIVLGFSLMAKSKLEERKAMYTVVAPNTIFSRSTYTVHVYNHHSSKTLGVQIELRKPKDAHSRAVTFEPLEANIKSGEGKTFRFKTKHLTREIYELIVTGLRGIEFEERAAVPVNQKTASILIQTDKGIYQAGQNVKFRVFTLDSNLLAITPLVDVIIYDGYGNRIKQWLNTTVENGVFKGEIQLANTTAVGQWRIEVEEEESTTATTTFTVKEYTLPTFHVTIKTQPSYFTYNESDVLITVLAKYTYGQAVKGKAHLRITDEYCDFTFITNCDAKIYQTKETDFIADTVIPVNFVRDLDLPFEVYRYGNRNFKIQAVVVEDLTGISRNATEMIVLYENKIKLEFLPAGSFKPGMRFTQKLAVAQQDNTPVLDNVRKVNVTTNYFYRDQKPHVQSAFYEIPTNGIISITIIVPFKIHSVAFDAHYRDLETSVSVSKAPVSGNFEYIQLRQITENPQVSQLIEFEVTSSEPLLHKIILLVIGKDDIVFVKHWTPKAQTTQKLDYMVQESMAPMMTAIIYYVTQCGNLIVDAMTIEVEGIFRTPVSLMVTPNSTQPGDRVEVLVKTNPDARVFLLGFDESVGLLSAGNDITPDRVLNDLKDYELSNNYFYNPHTVKSLLLPFPWVTPHSPLQIFWESDLLFFQNFMEEPEVARPYHVYAMERSDSSFETLDGGGAGSAPGEVTSPGVRSHFLETFVWAEGKADERGFFSLTEQVPDSITTYQFSAVALDDKTGLGVTKHKTELTIFRKFFVTLSLPFAIIRGEVFNIRVLIFNYLNERITAKVTVLSMKNQFVFVDNEIESFETSKSVTISIPKQDGVAVDFKISARVIGYIDISVEAMANTAADAVIKKLLVKPEGVVRRENRVTLIDLRQIPDFTTTIDVQYPRSIVPESESVSISLIGDILGEIINNLENLVKMPAGCGEQAMLNLAPDVSIAQYFDKTYQLKGDLEKNIISNIEKGYQIELAYKHEDGSYSAFGRKDPSGSTWLTAFVIGVFYQAKQFITIDEKVLEEGLKFLGKQQHEDGSFVEEGRIFHKSMQGGAGDGVSLTAYVCLTLMEFDDPVNEIIVDKAIIFLESRKPYQYQLFDAIVATYALIRAKSLEANTFLRFVEERAIVQEDETHWSIPAEDDGGNALDIEASSYMILSYMVDNDIDKAFPIIRWLLKKQNEFGGFDSTQDTVVGVRAISTVAAKLISIADSRMILDVKTFGIQQDFLTFSVNSENRLVLQQKELHPSVNKISISSHGEGIAVAQISWSYNIYTVSKPLQQTFEITAKATEPIGQAKIFQVEVCTRQLKLGLNNMLVVEVWLPSGCVLDMNHLPEEDALKDIQKIEPREGNTKLNIYYYSLRRSCVTVNAIQSFVVTKSKQALVRVFDYYNPANFDEELYALPA